MRIGRMVLPFNKKAAGEAATLAALVILADEYCQQDGWLKIEILPDDDENILVITFDKGPLGTIQSIHRSC